MAGLKSASYGRPKWAEKCLQARYVLPIKSRQLYLYRQLIRLIGWHSSGNGCERDYVPHAVEQSLCPSHLSPVIKPFACLSTGLQARPAGTVHDIAMRKALNAPKLSCLKYLDCWHSIWWIAVAESWELRAEHVHGCQRICKKGKHLEGSTYPNRMPCACCC